MSARQQWARKIRLFDEVVLVLRRFLLLSAVFAAILSFRAAASESSDPSLELMIQKLADADPAARETAMHTLWLAGPAAQPLLEQAAKDDSPEIAERARQLLHHVRFGLLPDTPAEAFDLLDQYNSGDAARRAAAIGRLADLGPRGIRVLLAVRRQEPDERDRQLILTTLTPHAHEGAAALIADGDLIAAEALLQAAAPITDVAARDYAVFIMARGQLAPTLSRLKELQEKPSKGLYRELTYLCRAAGDLEGATRAAQETADTALFDQILIERENWKVLATRYKSRIGDSASIESLGFAAAFQRLAGDETGFTAAVDAINAHAVAHPDDAIKCSEILFLNSRPQEGIAVLLARKEYLRAMDYLLPRMEYRRAIELVSAAEAEHYPLLPQLQARSALALRFTGRIDEAHKILESLQLNHQPDVATWSEIIEAYREIDGEEKARAVLISTLGELHGEAAAELLPHARFPESFPAAYWWDFLRSARPDDAPAGAFKTLQDMAAGRISADELERLCESAYQQAMRIGSPSVRRDDALTNVGQTLFVAGRFTSAQRCFATLAEGSNNPLPLMRVGDCQVAREEFTAAAETYRLAWERDRTRPAPLALRAAALQKTGDSTHARESLDVMHLLPLGNDTLRVELAELLAANGLPEEARREQEIILQAGQFLSWGVCHVLRQQAEATVDDPARASRLWERAFQQNLKYNVSFADAWADAAVAALLHKTRAQGAIRGNDWSAVLREAAACHADSPGDADSMIQLVNELKQRGRSEADELFKQTIAGYASLAGQYPNSGPVQNLMAWFEARCHMNLDDALQHAQRATTLEPKNTASLDTLAEVYFQRGDRSHAIEVMKRCIELEPDEPQHRKQLERFEATNSK